MPTVIPNGGDDDITGAELAGYAAAVNAVRDWLSGTMTFADSPTGDLTSSEVQLVSNVETKLDAIVQGWVDSGGSGGHQRAVAQEVLRRAALMEGNVRKSVKQWAKPGRERALTEMFSVLISEISSRDRLLLELRERLNQSPF